MSDVNTSLLSEFTKWKSNNSIVALNSTTYYDGNDKFTWNYSSVGPELVVEKDYNYYFNTERPIHILGNARQNTNHSGTKITVDRYYKTLH